MRPAGIRTWNLWQRLTSICCLSRKFTRLNAICCSGGVVSCMTRSCFSSGRDARDQVWGHGDDVLAWARDASSIWNLEPQTVDMNFKFTNSKLLNLTSASTTDVPIHHHHHHHHLHENHHHHCHYHHLHHHHLFLLPTSTTTIIITSCIYIFLMTFCDNLTTGRAPDDTCLIWAQNILFRAYYSGTQSKINYSSCSKGGTATMTRPCLWCCDGLTRVYFAVNDYDGFVMNMMMIVTIICKVDDERCFKWKIQIPEWFEWFFVLF